MIILLRDDFFGSQRLAELGAAPGAADAQGLNLTVLDGPRLDLAELRAAAEAMPFLSDWRLVVVRRFFSASRATASGDAPARRGRTDSEREVALLDYLPNLPPFTTLVFVEDPDFKPTHPAVRAIRKLDGEVHLDEPPKGEELVRWISQRARQKGGRIDRAAAEALGEVPFEGLRELDNTLEMLVTYAGERPVSLADVRDLVEASRAVDVFALVDAVGARDRRQALGAYRQLVGDRQSPIFLLTMLARQFRLLLIAREAQDLREDVGAALKVAPFVAQKLGQQARYYPLERLVGAMEKLARTDQAIKTGQADEEIALELLLVELTEK